LCVDFFRLYLLPVLTPDYASIGYSRIGDFKAYKPEQFQDKINYGVDISTLVSMIENGEI